MKSIRLSLKNQQFDDQYTFELHGYLSAQQFSSTLGHFNQIARKNPPPGNKATWLGYLLIVWLLIGASAVYVWQQIQQSLILMIVPLLIALTALMFFWRYRLRRLQFENTILEICSRINATENIRGINYRFSKNGSDLLSTTPTSLLCLKAVYAIVIEFDDRYRALSSQQFNSPPEDTFYPYVNSPAPVHVYTEKNPSMFYEYS
ncbi:hypothetical protein BDF14DRAFT_1873551 [Spinellus fusiger]|nr:hypothetical protein BDF14DRAFT_1873551 [Spinellus fusiger]